MNVVVSHFNGIKLLALRDHFAHNLNEKSLYENYKVECQNVK